MTFDDKTVLITGGTRGIGRAMVEAFTAAGARVAFTFRSAAAEAAAMVAEKGDQVLAFQGDGARMESATAAVKAVMDAWGRLDILVNNAGITRDNLLLRMTESDWDAVIAVNLRSAFNFCKVACRPMMRQRFGRIINVSSVVGITGNAGQANYAASKAALFGLTRSLAKELGSRNITVNALAPGYVETDMTGKIGDNARKALLGQIPLRRVAVPGEIAQAALFLTSDQACRPRIPVCPAQEEKRCLSRCKQHLMRPDGMC